MRTVKLQVIKQIRHTLKIRIYSASIYPGLHDFIEHLTRWIVIEFGFWWLFIWRQHRQQTVWTHKLLVEASGIGIGIGGSCTIARCTQGALPMSAVTDVPIGLTALCEMQNRKIRKSVNGKITK